MAIFTHVGQIVAVGTTVEKTVVADRIGEGKYKLPEGIKVYAENVKVRGINEDGSMDPAEITSPNKKKKGDPKIQYKPINIDYGNGIVTCSSETKQIQVTYKERPRNILANVFEYKFTQERSSRDIQTIDMSYPIEDLGTTKIEGNLSAYAASDWDYGIIQNSFDNDQALELEIFTDSVKMNTFKAVFYNIEFSHTADEKIIFKADFKGYK